jgi:trehalose 6-phosphate phosphatase
MNCRSKEIENQLRQAGRMQLFLDYDGTLADFATSPDDLNTDSALVELLSSLARRPQLRLAVISGRRLKHLSVLLPIPGIWLAGVYGLELLTPRGESIDRLDYRVVRPFLEELKPHWEGLIKDQSGFFLEDKGWSLALHARVAEDRQARELLSAARRLAAEVIESPAYRPSLPSGHRPEGGIRGSQFQGLRQLGGEKFLEVCPELADKGKAVEFIRSEDPWPGAIPVVVGDDDKDERAFQVIQALGGIAIQVGRRRLSTQVDCRLASPEGVRFWLAGLGASGTSA